MKSLRKTLRAVFLLLLPAGIVRWFSGLLGCRIGKKCKVGFSWIWCDALFLSDESRIGHLNLIVLRRLLLHDAAYIGRLNVLKGPISVLLKKTAAIGNMNLVLRGPRGVSSGPCRLYLGELAKITANHRVDCTRSVTIGDFSTIGGAGTQLWTHGYVHDLEGPGRYRIDGQILIENNVYIGSRCFISMGIRIGKGVMIGGGTSVGGNISAPGLYISGPLRVLPRPVMPQENQSLVSATDRQLIETVYIKPQP